MLISRSIRVELYLINVLFNYASNKIIIIIIYKYYEKDDQLMDLGWIKMFSCRPILFYVGLIYS